ncbi:MAG: zinc ribbon domain-containing protein [Ruminiclostridium sp.]|nr:zinc ribbon domain-containing protein [Ruminiclostridium sp.]
MGKFCKNCGTQLKQDVKFCTKCGTENTPAEPQTLVDPQVRTSANLTPNIAFASATAGESRFAHALPGAGELPAAIGPLKVLSQGLSGLFRGFGSAIKDKKRLIPALILALLWFILTLLPLLGINPMPVRWLSFLSFAQGGTSGGLLGVVGGIMGKGVFAYFLMSLVIPLTRGQKPFAGIGSGIKSFFQVLRSKNPSRFTPLLIGAGIALIFYNFFAGIALLQNSMAGIAALLLSLRALSSKTGFLKRFLGAFTKNKNVKGSFVSDRVNGIIAGMVSGFTLSIPLSALNIHRFQLPYTLGASLLIAGLILGLALKSKKEVPA